MNAPRASTLPSRIARDRRVDCAGLVDAGERYPRRLRRSAVVARITGSGWPLRSKALRTAPHLGVRPRARQPVAADQWRRQRLPCMEPRRSADHFRVGAVRRRLHVSAAGSRQCRARAAHPQPGRPPARRPSLRPGTWLPGSMPTFTAANPHVPTSWSPYGANLAFDELEAQRGAGHLDSEPRRVAVAVPDDAIDESSPAFSPDGRWLRTYPTSPGGPGPVQPFPGPGGKWPVSTEAGRSRRGRLTAGSSTTARAIR